VKVSATEEYGVRCLMRLARAWPEGRAVTTQQVASDEGLPPHYAAKLVGQFRRGGLVRSARGVRGGVRLARPPERP
jgi:Rrf2 family protein